MAISKLRFVAFALLAVAGMPALAFDFSRMANVADGVVLEMTRSLIRSGEYRALVIDTLLPLTALTFFSFQLLKAALTKQESPWAVYISICLTILAVALIAKLYDPVTTEIYAFGAGLTKMVFAVTGSGDSDPLSVISHAQESVIATGNAIENIGTRIVVNTIYGLMFFTQAAAWGVLSGTNSVFYAIQVVGYLTIPFIFFKWSSRLFGGVITGMAWCLVTKMVAPTLVAVAAKLMEKFIELGGGRAWDLTTANYAELTSILLTFAVTSLLVASAPLIAGLIVGGKLTLVDVGGMASSTMAGIVNVASRFRFK